MPTDSGLTVLMRQGPHSRRYTHLGDFAVRFRAKAAAAGLSQRGRPSFLHQGSAAARRASALLPRRARSRRRPCNWTGRWWCTPARTACGTWISAFGGTRLTKACW